MPENSGKPYLGQGNIAPNSTKIVIVRTLWLFVQHTLFRFSPRPFFLWRNVLLRCFGAKIEEMGTVRVYPSARVVYPWKLELCSHTLIGPDVNLYNLGQITLKRGVQISQGCHLCSGTHDYRFWAMPLVTKQITINENTWIAADSFIGPGVDIGTTTIIGARSVVVSSQPSHSICAGNPCRFIKERPKPL